MNFYKIIVVFTLLCVLSTASYAADPSEGKENTSIENSGVQIFLKEVKSFFLKVKKNVLDNTFSGNSIEKYTLDEYISDPSSINPTSSEHAGDLKWGRDYDNEELKEALNSRESTGPSLAQSDVLRILRQTRGDSTYLEQTKIESELKTNPYLDGSADAVVGFDAINSNLRSSLLEKNSDGKYIYHGLYGYVDFSEELFDGEMAAAFISAENILSSQEMSLLGWGTLFEGRTEELTEIRITLFGSYLDISPEEIEQWKGKYAGFRAAVYKILELNEEPLPYSDKSIAFTRGQIRAAVTTEEKKSLGWVDALTLSCRNIVD